MPRTRSQKAQDEDNGVEEKELPTMLSNDRIYYVTNAPTGKAKCRKCKDVIKKDSIRFGMSSEQKMGFACDDIDPRGNGDGGYFRQVQLVRWYHFGCFRITKVMQTEMKTPDAFEGFKDLKREDKEKVAEFFGTGGGRYAEIQTKKTKKVSREVAALKKDRIFYFCFFIFIIFVLYIVLKRG